MDIHEYQAKAILADYGLPIAQGGLAYSPEQAAYRTREIGGEKWVVKAQAHQEGHLLRFYLRKLIVPYFLLPKESSSLFLQENKELNQGKV